LLVPEVKVEVVLVLGWISVLLGWLEGCCGGQR
jgi:hypothetical protein